MYNINGYFLYEYLLKLDIPNFNLNLFTLYKVLKKYDIYYGYVKMF